MGAVVGCVPGLNKLKRAKRKAPSMFGNLFQSKGPRTSEYRVYTTKGHAWDVSATNAKSASDCVKKDLSPGDKIQKVQKL